ncbi:hypothetical protein CVO77_14605 [Sphingopyxis lindanitolerans]|uniref:SnoaL-like domain-containing protein n=1 Tax=Sphingopyxis lindanitolerans TaxID=2054227 RepID=A0A2S8B1V5_9SPHN|nr:nuclear transport factor 2 family protein [Sphingopyxis lindanitolerans]PQM26288.1 hypothetical protein CVO77_14605 [Sphingopyxis lindanitolerans]
MGIEDNKIVVRRLMDRLTAGDTKGAVDLLSDDGRWWVGGKADLFPVAGYKNKTELRALLDDLILPMPNGLSMTIKSMIAEGDRVAAEVESYGEAPNGRLYNNEYHFLIIVRDGLIFEVREYLDTMHGFDVFVRP